MPTLPPAQPALANQPESLLTDLVESSADGVGFDAHRLRVRPTTHARFVRFHALIGTKHHDDTLRLLLDLYEVNSGAFAPTDIKDMSALLQQLLVMLAAVNATHMEIVDIIRAEHRGVYAKTRAIAEELNLELARVRAEKFPA